MVPVTNPSPPSRPESDPGMPGAFFTQFSIKNHGIGAVNTMDTYDFIQRTRVTTDADRKA